MALNRRAATTNLNNQENIKNVKSSTTVTGQFRRAALGEIGNKVTINRGLEQTNKANLLLKDKIQQKKLVVVKPTAQKAERAALKPPVQAVKPVVKNNIYLASQALAHSLASKKEVKQTKENDVKKETNVIKEVEPSSNVIPVEDIDEDDKKNPILVSVYSNDIYNHLRTLESEYPVMAGYLTGQEITPKMRCVLIDWLIEVHEQFHLMQETLYLTVATIDRFLQAFRTINRKRLQLVGVTAMFIASKYEEMYSPDISDFVYITDNAYTKAEILQMEMIMLRTLNFSFGRPLPLHFLRRYSKAGHAMPIHHTMAKYFLEQSLVHYEVCHYSPSLIAAAAIYLSFLLISNESQDAGQTIWSKTLVYYSTYKSSDVLPVVQEISAIMCNAEKSKYQAVRRKYTNPKHMRISLRPELKSPTLTNLASLRQE